jgi:hypothetical protein
MKEIVLYGNVEAVDYELQCLELAKSALQDRVKLLLAKGIDPTIDNIKIVNIPGQYDPSKKNLVDKLAQAYRKRESDKVMKIIEQFGDTALTNGWEAKVNGMVEEFKKDLLEGITDEWYFEHNHYIDCFDVVNNEVVLKEGIDRSYFMVKHSVRVPEDAYNKHVQACQMLNELLNHPENEYAELNRFFYFNPETKEFEINIQAYDPDFEKYRFFDVRNKEKEGDLYNKNLAKQYR